MERPPTWVDRMSRQVRRLPPIVVRVLTLIDIVLGVTPCWAYFLYRRWTGRRISIGEFAPIYARALRFVAKHLAHTGEGTGPFSLPWLSAAAVRRSPVAERADHEPKGSCGTCKNCCTTHWLPAAEREDCPYLGPHGCRVYGGLWWDFFNCGRYPATPAMVPVYDCERFGPSPAFSGLTQIPQIPRIPQIHRRSPQSA